MAETRTTAVRIPLQVGAELRLTSSGEIVIDNPETELAENRSAADAVFSYQFDAGTGMHILRLLDPVANHAHLSAHRRDD